MNLMLVVVPRYGALLMTVCGFLLLITVCGYFGMMPETPLIIRVEGAALDFQFGWCFWLALIAGGVCLTVGVIITTIEIVNPHSFSTILEVDYDTPYDRHVIIEDSRGRKFQKKKTSSSKLEEPEGLGHRILKRLSSKQKDDKSDSGRHNFELSGVPWNYHYRRGSNRNSHMMSNHSQEDDQSVISSYSNEHVNSVFGSEKPIRKPPDPLW